jgi:hypothetical protein
MSIAGLLPQSTGRNYKWPSDDLTPEQKKAIEKEAWKYASHTGECNVAAGYTVKRDYDKEGNTVGYTATIDTGMVTASGEKITKKISV